MYWATALGVTTSLERFDRAVDFHFPRLLATELVTGDLERKASASTRFVWNSSSSHAAEFSLSDSTVALVSGYMVNSQDTITTELAGVDWRNADNAIHLSGEYSAVVVDESAIGAGIYAFSDPAGSHPVYYGETEDLVVVSNDAHFVAVALGITELSMESSYQLLAFDHAITRETTLSGVFRLYAGEILRANAESGAPGIIITGQNRYQYPSAGVPTSDDHDDATFEGLVEGIRNNPVFSTGIKAAVGLSGGLDSRITVSAIARAIGPRVQAITLDLSDSDERSFATQVAATLGFDHRVVRMDAGTVSDLRSGWLLSGGQVPVNAAAGNVLFYRALGSAAHEPTIVVGAWPGDSMIGSYIPARADMVDPRTVKAAVRRWAQDRSRQWWSPTVARLGGSASSLERTAIDVLAESVLSASGTTAAQKISHWMTFARPFSQLAPARLSTDILAVTPILADGYLRRIFELSALDLIGRNFYRRMIHRQIPELREIATAPSGQPVDIAVRAAEREPFINHAFARLPLAMKQVVRKLRRIRHGTPDGSEALHWGPIMAAEIGHELVTEIGSLTIDASGTRHAQVLGGLLALVWSRSYLKEASEALSGELSSSGTPDPISRCG